MGVCGWPWVTKQCHIVVGHMHINCTIEQLSHGEPEGSEVNITMVLTLEVYALCKSALCTITGYRIQGVK